MNSLFGDLSNPAPQPEVKIVTKTEEVFLVLDSTIDELLNEMSSDPLCRAITIYPTQDGRWQISGNMRDRQSWNCIVADDIITGLATLHQREKQMRAGCNVSPQYTAGHVIA